VVYHPKFRQVQFGLLLLVAVAVRTSTAQQVRAGFQERQIEVEGSAYAYEVYVPRQYERQASWPVILALHGGQGGTGLRNEVDRFPAIIVFPRARRTWHGRAGRAAMSALDDVLAHFNADSSRVYLTGQSLGGNGAWYLAYEHPNRFAALIVVCGWVSSGPGGLRAAVGPPEVASNPFDAVAERLAHLPVWIFHGETDDVIPVDESRKMSAALQARDANVTYTEFLGVGHDAWDLAYGYDGLPDWLLEKSRH